MNQVDRANEGWDNEIPGATVPGKRNMKYTAPEGVEVVSVLLGKAI